MADLRPPTPGQVLPFEVASRLLPSLGGIWRLPELTLYNNIQHAKVSDPGEALALKPFHCQVTFCYAIARVLLSVTHKTSALPMRLISRLYPFNRKAFGLLSC